MDFVAIKVSKNVTYKFMVNRWIDEGTPVVGVPEPAMGGENQVTPAQLRQHYKPQDFPHYENIKGKEGDLEIF